jgi:TRAP-type C4-dicarboxylate transport system permease small subunit
MLKKLIKIKATINKIVLILSEILILLIAFISFMQVVARYFFNSPFFWTEEISRIFMIYMTFMGASIVLSKGEHLSLDLLLNYSSGVIHKIQKILISLFILLFSISMTFYSAKMITKTWYMVTPLGFPRGFIYLALVIGGFLLILESIVILLQEFEVKHLSENIEDKKPAIRDKRRK